MGGSSFTRSLVGGLAGGFLGSMLFRQLGFAGTGMPGQAGGGIGMLEILLMGALAYFVFRHFVGRKLANSNASSMNAYDKLRAADTGPYAAAGAAGPADEASAASTLKIYDTAFDLESFKETRMDDFMRLQSAWNFRDLSSVSSLVAPEIFNALNDDIAQLKNERRINRIENIAVRGTQLVDAWQEFGKEFATVRFKANLVDYTVDETSGELVSGNKVEPVKFQEDWTFVREMGSAPSSRPWKLTAIEN